MREQLRKIERVLISASSANGAGLFVSWADVGEALLAVGEVRKALDTIVDRCSTIAATSPNVAAAALRIQDEFADYKEQLS